MSREICGECKYNKYSTTMYDDTCVDFEEKDD